MLVCVSFYGHLVGDKSKSLKTTTKFNSDIHFSLHIFEEDEDEKRTKIMTYKCE